MSAIKQEAELWIKSSTTEPRSSGSRDSSVCQMYAGVMLLSDDDGERDPAGKDSLPQEVHEKNTICRCKGKKCRSHAELIPCSSD